MDTFIRWMAVVAIIMSPLSCEVLDDGGNDDPSSDGLEYSNRQAKSPKRGVSFNFGQLPEDDCPLLGEAVSWSYDWSNNIPSAKTQAQFDKYGIEFIQMCWNNHYNEANIRNYKASHPEVEYLLGFNEPNLTDQCNMTPSVAAGHWPAVVSLAKQNGLKLISPAMNYGTLSGYHDPYKWLDEFFAIEGISLDDIDGMAVHCYMGTVSALKGFMQGFKKYGKPLWLTEFCNWDGKVSLTSQMEYMVESINYLEQDKDVERYAWFIPRGTGNSDCYNNLLSSGKRPITLTDLGVVFVNMSSFDKSLFYRVDEVIPAEHYVSCQGALHLAPLKDDKGILELYDLRKQCSVDYQVDVPSAGEYTLQVRYNSYRKADITFRTSQGEVTIQLPDTKKQWMTESFDITLPEGRQTITIESQTEVSPKYNWFRIIN